MKIACLDFETANHSRVSMCSVGLAIFDDGLLVESPGWLVKPPKGHGFFIPEWTEDIHGLNWFDVQHAPEFSQIAAEVLSHLIKADIVIAHNATFDMDVLRQSLAHYQMPCPDFRYLCTYRLAKRVWPDLPNHQLSTLAAHIGHTFQHHQAQSDAEAAGRVLLAIMRQMKLATLDDLFAASTNPSL